MGEQMEIPEIVKSALKNTEVKVLFEQIKASSSVKFEEVHGGIWTSTWEQGSHTIQVTNTGDPAAAMYHELLHADLKNKGYAQYCTVVSTTQNASELINLLQALDNELQHHRMFMRFTGAGFAPDKFYNDGDKSTLKKTRERIKKWKNEPIIEVVLVLLTIIAPGGYGTDDERKKLRNFLSSKCSKTRQKKITKIESILTDWTFSTSLNASDTIRNIIEEIGGYDRTWVGKNKSFPNSGVFIGIEFDIKDAVQLG